MDDLHRYVITLLALINPVNSALILQLNAALEPRLLHNPGISLDVFRIVGGLILIAMGLQIMLTNLKAVWDWEWVAMRKIKDR